MKKSLLFAFVILFFNQFGFGQDTIQTKKVELTKDQLIARIDSARVLAITLLENTPDTLGIKDPLLTCLRTAHVFYAKIDSFGVMMVSSYRYQKHDFILAENSGINFLRTGYFSDHLFAAGFYKDPYGIFMNRLWLEKDVSLEEIALVMVHELVHFAQAHKFNLTVSLSFENRYEVEKQAWWFQSFVYASNHPEVFQNTVICDDASVKIFFKAFGFSLANNMLWILHCPDTFFGFAGH